MDGGALVRLPIPDLPDGECVTQSDGTKSSCSGTKEAKELIQVLRAHGEEIKPSAGTPVEDVVDRVKRVLGCTMESCIYQHPEVVQQLGEDRASEILRRLFKPAGSHNPAEWLSNIDIDDVLQRVARDHKDFKHIQVHMIDFDEQDTPLHRTNLADEYGRGVRCVGVVLNTDRRSGPGKHWVSMVCDMRDKKNFTIEYFNSSGNPPAQSIQLWMHRQKENLERNTAAQQVTLRVSRERLQEDNASCGIWSISYVWGRVRGIPAEWYTRRNIDDKSMDEIRTRLFRGDERSLHEEMNVVQSNIDAADVHIL